MMRSKLPCAGRELRPLAARAMFRTKFLSWTVHTAVIPIAYVQCAIPSSLGQDAARVCDSLAKTNVKVLGESRVSLTRSLARLEQLDARMSGNLGPLTRHFKGRNR